MHKSGGPGGKPCCCCCACAGWVVHALLQRPAQQCWHDKSAKCLALAPGLDGLVAFTRFMTLEAADEFQP